MTHETYNGISTFLVKDTTPNVYTSTVKGIKSRRHWQRAHTRRIMLSIYGIVCGIGAAAIWTVTAILKTIGIVALIASVTTVTKRKELLMVASVGLTLLASHQTFV